MSQLWPSSNGTLQRMLMFPRFRWSWSSTLQSSVPPVSTSEK
jgi:hypothetical protein